MSSVKDKDLNRIDKEDKFIIEEAFTRLEEINKSLENPDTSLKDSLIFYEEGVKLVNACRENLEGIEKEIQILNAD
ncbi:MAG: exodeoxyribonuclease VII small subunit [Lachnospiraceae bacterium]|nr:exodeoxyribonuclease VII small subunit [Lachnospiraceae bacterium]